MVEKDLERLLDALPLEDGMRISFHHHLRNGDDVLNPVLKAIMDRGYKHLHLKASALFPVHKQVVKALKSGCVTDITTNYVSGPVADHLSKEGLEGSLTMQTHGGRARSIIEGGSPIDIAFIAAPAVDESYNASGVEGKNPCGSLGYAIEDAQHAAVKVLVTDTLTTIEHVQIEGRHIDHVLKVDSIGDTSGIESGTLAISSDPIKLKIAREAMRLLKALDAIQEGVSFQSGAGGVSLAVTAMFNDYLKTHGLKASFYSGGITAGHVEALEEGLVGRLYDVQCFDKRAIASLKQNEAHIPISASDYANPSNASRVIGDLDIVLLGASEVDLDFNVNVTSDSYLNLIGGSGGHSDTAEDSRLTIVVAPLIKARTPLIQDRVQTITTPGAHVDCVVSERGIAVNPARRDLIRSLEKTSLPIMSIEEMQALAHHYTKRPAAVKKGDVIGIVESRSGGRLDTIHKKVV